jgi:hypothetical protein
MSKEKLIWSREVRRDLKGGGGFYMRYFPLISLEELSKCTKTLNLCNR